MSLVIKSLLMQSVTKLCREHCSVATTLDNADLGFLGEVNKLKAWAKTEDTNFVIKDL